MDPELERLAIFVADAVTFLVTVATAVMAGMQFDDWLTARNARKAEQKSREGRPEHLPIPDPEGGQ